MDEEMELLVRKHTWGLVKFPTEKEHCKIYGFIGLRKKKEERSDIILDLW